MTRLPGMHPDARAGRDVRGRARGACGGLRRGVFIAYEHASGVVNAEPAPVAHALLARIGVSVYTT
jgi:hypothetical protein